MSGVPHERIFPARRDALPEVEAVWAEVCAAAALDRAMCLRVTLQVEELFTNTVVHGHGALPGDSLTQVALSFGATNWLQPVSAAEYSAR